MFRNRKKKTIIVLCIGILTGFMVYVCSPTYSWQSFFLLRLSDHNALVNWLPEIHYALRSVVALGALSLDREGKIYIVGYKGSSDWSPNRETRILVINRHGEVEKIMVPRWKDGTILPQCFHLSVSPSGRRIWTWDKTAGISQVTVHGYEGTALATWPIKYYSTTYLLLTALSDNEAYGLTVGENGQLINLHFVVGKAHAQKCELRGEILPTFFHNGRYWAIKTFDALSKLISDPVFHHPLQMQGHERKWLGVVTWSPKEGFRLVRKFKDPSGYNITTLCIQWIDRKENIYGFHYDWSPPWVVNLLSKVEVLKKLFKALNIPLERYRPLKVLLVLSREGKLAGKIVVPLVIRPKRGEKLEYGQLVKVDETGIYLEVERVSEPREYRIVKIVKKPRWKVWWEKLTKRTER